MKNKINHLSISNCGLFMGFTADPSDNSQINEEPIDEKEVKAIFESYKSYLIESATQYNLSTSQSKKSYENLYAPEIWHISGYFSKLYISLVDDFIFGSRHFRPYNSIITKYNETDLPKTSFLYQSQVGLYYSDTSKLEEKYIKIRKKKYPFISISNLKLNNGYLVGNGLAYSTLVIKKILSILKNKKLDGLVLLTLGWNELCLIIYSDTQSDFLNVLNEIRSYTLKDILKYCRNSKKKSIIDNCLISNSVFCSENDNYNVLDGHVISHSYSYYGFKDLKSLTDEKLDTTYRTVFYVKSGHGRSLKEDIIDKILNIRIDPKIVIGNGDLVYEFSGSQMKCIIENMDRINLHIDKYIATPQHTYQAKGELVTENHPYYYSTLNKLQFREQQLNALYNSFDKLGISSNVRSRFINMYVKFQHACRDPIMYSFFIDLKPALLLMIELMENKKFKEGFKDVKELSTYLLDFSYNIEQSLFSRYGTSYEMSEVPDWNMDFSGGLQGILSSFEFNYQMFESYQFSSQINKKNENIKTISKNNRLRKSFIFLSSKPGNKSMDYAFRIDAFHIYQSEFFAFVLWKEVANWLPLENQFTSIKDNYTLIDDKTKYILFVLIRDLFHYRMQFFNNWELYSYWFFGTICQNSDIYKFDGEIDEEKAILYIERYLLVKYLANNLNEDESIFFSKIHPLKDIYISNVYIINEHITQFIANYIGILKQIDDESYYNVLRIIGIKKYSDSKLERMTEITGFFNIYNEIPQDKNLEKIISWILKNSEEDNPENFTENLLVIELTYEAYTLLLNIYSKSNVDSTKKLNYIKHRENNIHMNLNNNNLFQFHQLGGAYCYFPKLRKELLQFRVKYLLNIWDKAQIYKKGQIIDLIE